jgi:hypothetical protein
VRGAARVQMTLDRDGYAKDQPVTFDDSLKRIAFELESRGGGAHQATLRLKGLPAGNYRVLVNGKAVGVLPGQAGQSHDIKIPIEATGATRVTINRT